MTHTSPPATGTTSGPGQAENSMTRVVSASFIGTALEYYDFFIYGTAASVAFGQLFFPSSDPVVGLLLALATYAVGYVFRPLGAVIFGHYGDRIGRKNVLIATLMLMGFSTAAVGLLPTYGSVGLLAPVLLVTLRLLQGVGLGGEWGGAALMVAESDRSGRRGLFGSLIQVAAPVGLLLATGVFSLITALLSNDAFLAWGWRLPFLASGLLVVVGIWVRRNLVESPLFVEAEAKHEKAKAPIREVLAHHKRSIVLAVGARVGSDIAFYVFALFVLVYATNTLGMPRSIALTASLASALAQIIAIPIFGALSDRIGRRPVIIGGAIAGILYSFVFFEMLDTREPALVIAAPAIGLFIVAAMYAPIAAFIPELFTTKVRYTGSAVGFQLAGVFGGGWAPLICAGLVAKFDSAVPVALYLSATLVVLVVSVYVARETCRSDMHEVGA